MWASITKYKANCRSEMHQRSRQFWRVCLGYLACLPLFATSVGRFSTTILMGIHVLPEACSSVSVSGLGSSGGTSSPATWPGGNSSTRPGEGSRATPATRPSRAALHQIHPSVYPYKCHSTSCRMWNLIGVACGSLCSGLHGSNCASGTMGSVAVSGS